MGMDRPGARDGARRGLRDVHVVIEAAGGGWDVVHAWVSHALGDRVERLVTTGSAPVTGVGNNLANRLTGNAYDTILRGAAGADTIVGGAAHDNLFGGVGNDVLSGGAGNGIFSGGAGRDASDSRAGDDTLIGGTGRDLLSGGARADVFVFRLRSDRDVILDFQEDIDAIRLVDLGISNFDQARVHATQNDAHVVFDFGDGDSLTVRNTTITLLGDDLIFV